MFFFFNFWHWRQPVNFTTIWEKTWLSLTNVHRPQNRNSLLKKKYEKENNYFFSKCISTRHRLMEGGRPETKWSFFFFFAFLPNFFCFVKLILANLGFVCNLAFSAAFPPEERGWKYSGSKGCQKNNFCSRLCAIKADILLNQVPLAFSKNILACHGYKFFFFFFSFLSLFFSCYNHFVLSSCFRIIFAMFLNVEK